MLEVFRDEDVVLLVVLDLLRSELVFVEFQIGSWKDVGLCELSLGFFEVGFIFSVSWARSRSAESPRGAATLGLVFAIPGNMFGLDDGPICKKSAMAYAT